MESYEITDGDGNLLYRLTVWSYDAVLISVEAEDAVNLMIVDDAP